jgi:Ran GTPase-activating protein (RanGAP) involved in mRNA processing and transport
MEHINENKYLRKLSLSLGVMKTVRPLVQCLTRYSKLQELSLSNLELGSRLHFATIDNYLIYNPTLVKLTLSNVKMGYD